MSKITSWLKQAEGLEQKEWNCLGHTYIAIPLDPITGKRMAFREAISRKPYKEQPEWFTPEELQDAKYYEIVISDRAYYGQI
jgi:hypothetical protein